MLQDSNSRLGWQNFFKCSKWRKRFRNGRWRHSLTPPLQIHWQWTHNMPPCWNKSQKTNLPLSKIVVYRFFSVFCRRRLGALVPSIETRHTERHIHTHTHTLCWRTGPDKMAGAKSRLVSRHQSKFPTRWVWLTTQVRRRQSVWPNGIFFPCFFPSQKSNRIKVRETHTVHTLRPPWWLDGTLRFVPFFV